MSLRDTQTVAGSEAVPPASAGGPVRRRVALLGNPNTGKTTLFNRLTGLRHKTANFPGTTLEARVGRVRAGGTGGDEPGRAVTRGLAGLFGRQPSWCRCSEVESGAADETSPAGMGSARGPVVEVIDLPGAYSLELEQPEAAICRAVLEGRAAPRGEQVAEPDAVCVVVDATNLSRGLMLVGEALRRRLPMVVAVNMIDVARRRGIRVEARVLEEQLGCPVVCTSARTGEGIEALARALRSPRLAPLSPPGTEAGLRDWAEALHAQAAGGDPGLDADSLTDRLDRVFTHPVLGALAFVAVMGGLFWAIFALAQYPMTWIDMIVATLGSAIERVLPAGDVRDLLAQGVVGGIGATVVFLPQIALLFFLIALLEDTGYLARAALVVDRVLRPFGLPGHAFIPLLSSHACALPGLIATRAIPDARQRLTTILVAPFMTCSARLPVYVLLTGILFAGRPGWAALAMVGCYALGIGAGLISALVARRTLLRGASRPMALELPPYRLPDVATAARTAVDRGAVFLRQAGTNILAICVVLWWLSAYPHVAPPPQAQALRQQAQALVAAGDAEQAGSLLAEADRLERAHARANSFAGRLGRALQPLFSPLGYDWQLTVGVLSSFAAREVFVSTMAVVVAGEEEIEGVLETVARATRDDGTPIFTRPVCWSLLIYYVLAMQCLPTLAVTAKEAGGVRWALLQLGWMSGLAYAAAAAVYAVLA